MECEVIDGLDDMTYEKISLIHRGSLILSMYHIRKEGRAW